MHPGASDIRRRWLPEYFALVGDNLALKGATIVISGIKEEQEVINAVLENMEHKAINLCGKLTLCGFAGLLSYASLVITNDTGPLHLAHALGTPTVGLYWCGNMINGGQITRSIHRPVISWVINCQCVEQIVPKYSLLSHKKNNVHMKHRLLM